MQLMAANVGHPASGSLVAHIVYVRALNYTNFVSPFETSNLQIIDVTVASNLATLEIPAPNLYSL